MDASRSRIWTRSVVWAWAAAVLVACDSGSSGAVDAGPGTWPVDCIAVLGAPNARSPTNALPPAGIPVSGVAREKLISDLTDSELGHLCDWEACMGTNGRGRTCYFSDTLPAFGGDRFHLEAPSILADALHTCYPLSWDDAIPDAATMDYSLGSREDCMVIHRNYYGSCHVGSTEDCRRNAQSSPMGSDWWYSTDACVTTHDECGVP